MIPLEIFMDEAARRPFDPGEHDCLLMLADWVLNVRGVDPAADLRGRYHTRLGYLRLLAVRGGVVATVSACARKAGLEITSAPKRGDIGLVYARVEGEGPKPKIVGAICCGARWIALGKNGVVGAKGPIVARAWSV